MLTNRTIHASLPPPMLDTLGCWHAVGWGRACEGIVCGLLLAECANDSVVGLEKGGWAAFGVAIAGVWEWGGGVGIWVGMGSEGDSSGGGCSWLWKLRISCVPFELVWI